MGVNAGDPVLTRLPRCTPSKAVHPCPERLPQCPIGVTRSKLPRIGVQIYPHREAWGIYKELENTTERFLNLSVVFDIVVSMNW